MTNATTITRTDVANAIAASGINGYFVTEDAEGAWLLPGVVIFFDGSDSANAGWAYRYAQHFDADTTAWDGEESGAIDDQADLDEIIAIAVEHAAALEAE